MLFFNFLKNKNIVHIDYTEIINEAAKSPINIRLEDSRGISKPKRYN